MSTENNDLLATMYLSVKVFLTKLSFQNMAVINSSQPLQCAFAGNLL